MNKLEYFLEENDYEKILDFDLTKQMMWYPEVKECVNDVCFKIGFNEDDVIDIFQNDERSIERYLLFRIQGAFGIGFDCDHSMLGDYNGISDSFFSNYGGIKYGVEMPKDTLFSMQTFWGKVVSIWFKNQEISSELFKYFEDKYGYYKDGWSGEVRPKVIKANKFIWELIHIDEIKEKLSGIIIEDYSESNGVVTNDLTGKEINLWDAFKKFAKYYHSIGNMSPCPNPPYNMYKGAFGRYRTKFYDRADLFLECVKSENWKFAISRDWFNMFTKEKITKEEIRENILTWYYDDAQKEKFSKNVYDYMLEEVLKNDLPKKITLPVAENKNALSDIGKYLIDVMEIIKKRGEQLIKKVK